MKQIISPHIDDAFLSLGGSILNGVKRKEKVKIGYIFTKSVYTNPDPISGEQYGNDENVITGLRKDEEKEINQLLEYDFYFLDYPDNSLRQKYGMNSENHIKTEIKNELANKINKNEVCFFPLGLGHVDHHMTREIGIQLVGAGYKIKFYEDMPYMTWQNYLEAYNLIKNNVFFPLVEEYEEIDFQTKLNILNCYRSQVSGRWLSDIAAYSYSPKDNKYYERYWKLKE